VRLVISDDHPSIRQAVMAELPGASWQRCVVHFMRNVLAHVPQSERGVVAEELQEVFVARRRGTAESLARGFVERYRDRFKRAVEVFAQGLGEALTYLDFPSGHQRHIKSTNVLERLIREVKRRTRVVGVFPGEGSLVNLATVVMLRATAAFPSGKHGEDWAFRRYLDMGPLWAVKKNPQKSRLDPGRRSGSSSSTSRGPAVRSSPRTRPACPSVTLGSTTCARVELLLQTLLNGLLIAGVYALVATGLALSLGVVGIVNFAHGEFLMVGAFLSYLLFATPGGGPPLLPGSGFPGRLPGRGPYLPRPHPSGPKGSRTQPDAPHFWTFHPPAEPGPPPLRGRHPGGGPALPGGDPGPGAFLPRGGCPWGPSSSLWPCSFSSRPSSPGPPWAWPCGRWPRTAWPQGFLALRRRGSIFWPSAWRRPWPGWPG
jgi:hypothetical protein